MRDAQPLVINNKTKTGGIKSNICDFILGYSSLLFFSMKIMLFILLEFLFTN